MFAATAKIVIQEDGCPVHNKTEVIQAKAKEMGMDITVVKQPPCSPDFNCLDAGIFNSVQKAVYRDAPTTVDKLVSSVSACFDKMHRNNVNDVFYSVQMAMTNSLTVDGNNTAKLGHIGKGKLRKEG